MENKCGYCNKKTLSLRRCSACQVVYYCSPACQRRDWKGQHKVKCKELQARKETEDLSDDTPYIPEKGNTSGTLLYPSQPWHRIPYEKSVELVRSKGKNRHVLHDNVSNRDHIIDDTQMYKTCSVCNKRDAVVKSCSACNIIDYCSRECQKKDWKKHKLFCLSVKVSRSASPLSRDSSNSPSHFIRPLPENPDLSLRCYPDPDAFHKVKSLAWKIFHGCEILDFIREIPSEGFGMKCRRVIIGFISRFHEYMARHCIFLQDKDGDEVYVAFYFERDDPSPYFRWEEVVPGRYICIENPFIHGFMDGSVGIRVDKPSAVRVFSF